MPTIPASKLAGDPGPTTPASELAGGPGLRQQGAALRAGLKGTTEVVP